MVENPLSTIFGFIGSFYGLTVPLVTVVFISLIFLVSLQGSGKPKSIGQAIYCYITHGVSVLLMTVGALPTVFSVFAGVAYTGRTYVALLLVFACGGLLFLVQDQAARTLDSASKAIPEAIYMTTLKVIGNLMAIASGLSLLLSIVIGSFQPGWWVTPFVLLLYGLLLSWCTRDNQEVDFFKSMQLAPAKPARAVTKPKAKAKRKAKKKK